MKTLLAPLAALLLATTAAFADADPNPQLTDEERAELLQMLDESRDMLMGLIENCSEAQWRFQENPDRWSVAQCAEHIIRSEAALLDLAKAAMASEPNPEWHEKTKDKSAFLRQVMPNRRPQGQGGASAPMEIRPTENWTKDETIAKFDAQRETVRTYVESISGPVKSHTQEHPFPVFNTLNAYDWLIYIPLHTVRHSRQIVEVQEAENYPGD